MRLGHACEEGGSLDFPVAEPSFTRLVEGRGTVKQQAALRQAQGKQAGGSGQ